MASNSKCSATRALASRCGCLTWPQPSGGAPPEEAARRKAPAAGWPHVSFRQVASRGQGGQPLPGPQPHAVLRCELRPVRHLRQYECPAPRNQPNLRSGGPHPEEFSFASCLARFWHVEPDEAEKCSHKDGGNRMLSRVLLASADDERRLGSTSVGPIYRGRSCSGLPLCLMLKVHSSRAMISFTRRMRTTVLPKRVRPVLAPSLEFPIGHL